MEDHWKIIGRSFEESKDHLKNLKILLKNWKILLKNWKIVEDFVEESKDHLKMPPNWFVRSTSQRGDGGDAVVVVPQETIDAFQEFFDAEDLTTVMNAFTSLCQMLDIVPGKTY